MAPRTILYTGKGGVGKTSVAAATARRFTRYLRRPPPGIPSTGLGCDRHPPQINLDVPAAPAAR